MINKNSNTYKCLFVEFEKGRMLKNFKREKMDILVFVAIAVVFCLVVGKMNFTKPKNIYDDKYKNYGEKVASELVKILRARATEFIDKSALKGNVNIEHLSDEQIFKIAQEVAVAFKNVAHQKGERIPGAWLLHIALKFILAYALMGEWFYKEHLNYEIDRYKRVGLRDDYKRDFFYNDDELKSLFRNLR